MGIRAPEQPVEERQDSSHGTSVLRRAVQVAILAFAALSNQSPTVDAEEPKPASVATDTKEAAPKKEQRVRKWEDLENGDLIDFKHGDITVFTIGEGDKKREVPTFFSKKGDKLHIDKKNMDDKEGKTVELLSNGHVITVKEVHVKCEGEGKNRCLIIKGSAGGFEGDSKMTAEAFAQLFEALQKDEAWDFTIKSPFGEFTGQIKAVPSSDAADGK